MKPIFYDPHAALRNFISHYMIVDIKMPHGSYAHCIPFPPTPQHSIHFYPADPIRTSRHDGTVSYSPESMIVGPQVTRVDLAMGKNHVLLSVAFHPGGLFRLLNIPLTELYDLSYDATEILGNEIKEVNEKLKMAANHLTMKNIVEGYLLKKIKPTKLSGFELSARLMLNEQSLTINQAAGVSCLSLRQFERKAKEQIGYSPKFFQRMVRFSKAYRLKVSQPLLSWTQISYTCGYYDQMHLIRDFKEFAGANPELLAKDILASPVQVQDHLRI